MYPTLDYIKAIIPGEFEAQYTYTDPNGNPVLVVLRFKTPDGKTFRQITPVEGGYVMKAPPKPLPLYNLKGVLESDFIIFVEGEKCVDILGDYGFVATTTSGGAGNSKHTDLSPLKGKNVIIWPDNDSPGWDHANEVKEELLKLGCKVFMIKPPTFMLNEKDDVADYINRLNLEGKDHATIETFLCNAIEDAVPCRVSGDLCQEFRDIALGRRASVKLPFTLLTKLSNALLPGTVTLLCGAPGAGKSFLIIQFLLYWLKNKVPFACYMLEEDRKYHLKRALAVVEGNAKLLDEDYIKGNFGNVVDAYERNADLLDKLGLCLCGESDKLVTYKDVIEWMNDRAQAGCRVLVVDPITACAQVEKPWIEDGKLLDAVKKAAGKKGISIIFVTHPRKGQTKPTIDDLAGGAAFQRFVQAVLWLEHHKSPKTVNVRNGRDHYEVKVNRTIHICKVRNASGHGLSVGVNFNGDTLNFEEEGLIIAQSMDEDRQQSMNFRSENRRKCQDKAYEIEQAKLERERIKHATEEMRIKAQKERQKNKENKVKKATKKTKKKAAGKKAAKSDPAAVAIDSSSQQESAKGADE